MELWDKPVKQNRTVSNTEWKRWVEPFQRHKILLRWTRHIFSLTCTFLVLVQHLLSDCLTNSSTMEWCPEKSKKCPSYPVTNKSKHVQSNKVERSQKIPGKIEQSQMPFFFNSTRIRALTSFRSFSQIMSQVLLQKKSFFLKKKMETQRHTPMKKFESKRRVENLV